MIKNRDIFKKYSEVVTAYKRTKDELKRAYYKGFIDCFGLVTHVQKTGYNDDKEDVPVEQLCESFYSFIANET